MKTIQLTLGHVALIDDENFEWLNRYKWHTGKCSGKLYAVRKGRLSDGVLYKKPIYMHRQILGLLHDSELVADHIDGNGLNNTISNLRKCSKKENSYNKKKVTKPKTSRFHGVTHIPDHHCWLSQISGYFIGHYQTEEEAAYYYNEEAKKRHGEFAVLNDLSGIVLDLTPRKNRKSPYKGIRFNKRDKLWYARIMQHRKEIYLGCYKTAQEAAIAYNQKAIELHGDKARLNDLTEFDSMS